MAQKLEVPRFADETEEARRWFENQHLVADEFELAAREGRLGHGRAIKRVLAARGLLQHEPEDAERDRQLPKNRGMDYHAYLSNVLHQALLVEEKSA